MNNISQFDMKIRTNPLQNQYKPYVKYKKTDPFF
jgi:hypothetical protein